MGRRQHAHFLHFGDFVCSACVRGKVVHGGQETGRSEGRVEVVEKVLEKEKIEMLFLNHANEYTPFARLVLSVYVSVHGFLGNIPLPSIVEFEDYLWNEALKAGDLVEDLEHLRHDEPLSSEMLSLMREQIEAVVQRFVEIDDDV